MVPRRTTCILLLIFLLAEACSLNRYGDGYTLPVQKKAPVSIKAAEIPISYRFYYPDTAHAKLFFRVDPHHFLFSTNASSGQMSAHIQVACSFYASPAKSEALSKQFIQFHPIEKEKIGDSLSLDFNAEKVYYELIVTDLNKGQNNTFTGWLKKDASVEQLYFLPYDAPTGFPIVESHATVNTLYMRSEHYAKQPWNVFTYKQLNFAAPAPFSTKGYLPDFNKKDSSYIVFNASSIRQIAVCDSGKFVVCSPDNTLERGSGFLIENKTSNPLHDFAALRYITTRDEYEQLIASKNIQADLENFWLYLANKDAEQAQKLSLTFLERTREANRLFTSYKLGWQTDRGMVYIVFGPPTSIQDAPNQTVWTYGNPSVMSALSFVFNKEYTSFVSNNYTLYRNADFKPFWYQTVESWRSGMAQKR